MSFPQTCLAQEEKSLERDPGTTVSILVDQDFFTIPASLDEDRNYTMGLAFDFSNDKINDWFTHWPLIKLHQLFSSVGIYDGAEDLFSSSIGLLGTAFTPEKLDTTSVVVGDRPYAFFLGINTRSTHRCVTEQSRHNYHSWNINYGLFGTYIGREVQSYIHSWPNITRPDPIGWSNQIGEGGRFAMLVDYNFFKTLRKDLPDIGSNLQSKIGFDGGWTAGASAGYYNRMYAGVGVRAGLIDIADVYNWLTAFNSVSTGSYQAIKSSGEARSELFVMLQLRGTYMIRNNMLEGGWFADEIYVLESEWTKPFVGEVSIGAGASKKWLSRTKPGRIRTLAAVYKTTYRTPEFDSGIFDPRNHAFGSLGFIFSF